MLTLKAIYPQPCCPSLRHGTAEALELDESPDDAALLEAIQTELAARGMSGRMAGYRVDQAALELRVLAAAADMALAGETVDAAALAKPMDEIGGCECELGCYREGNTVYENVILYAVQSTVF